MRYVRFTYVDAKTQTPVTKEPAKNGPDIPHGVVPTFTIESSYGGYPILYGIVEDDTFELQDWMAEITEEDFFSIFKRELKDRARNKRWQVERSGIVVGSSFIRTTIEDQNRISNMVTSLNLVTTMGSIDFEYAPGEWATLTREEGLAIGAAVAEHVQSCFSWCKTVHTLIDELALTVNNLGDVLPILQEIEAYGQPTAVV